MNRRTYVPWLLAGGLALVSGLSCRGDRPAEATPPVATGSPVSVDFSALRFKGPDDVVLVEARGKPFIRAGEFNAWLGTYPLEVDKQGAEAFRQVLEQMVTFKLLAQKAREVGYRGNPTGNLSADERTMVLSYIRDQVTNISLVSDKQAEEYVALHPERFQNTSSEPVPPQVRDLAVKGTIRGQQLRELVKSWKATEEITYPEPK